MCFDIEGDQPACRILICRWLHVTLSAASTRNLSRASDSVLVASFRSPPRAYAALYAVMTPFARCPTGLSFLEVFFPWSVPSMASSSSMYACAMLLCSPRSRADVATWILILTLYFTALGGGYIQVGFRVEVHGG